MISGGINENSFLRNGEDDSFTKEIQDQDTETTISRSVNSLAGTQSKTKTWSEMSCVERLQFVGVILLKILLLLVALYFFFFGLSLMGTSFKVLAGRAHGNLFGFVNDPIAGVCVGILATVLVQSSSTSTSIVVGLVGSGTANSLTVHQAIPIIIGCNIGTSITAQLVSFVHVNKPKEFERAFAGASINFFYNVLVTLFLLPIELLFGMLEKTSAALRDLMFGRNTATFESPIHQAVAPLVDNILEVDLGKLTDIANGIDVPGSLISGGVFQNTLSDVAVGAILIVISIVVLIVSLLCFVKLLSSCLKGSATRWIRFGLGKNNYLALVIGLVATVAVQSSSITTATLVPLVGLGIVTLSQMYPLTLGANIGKTVIPLLAALATDSTAALQIAIVHLLFNIIGVTIWFPIPFMRKPPLVCAAFMGREVGERKTLAVTFVATTFLAFPAIMLGLSVVSPAAVIVGLIFIATGIVAFFAVLLARRGLLPCMCFTNRNFRRKKVHSKKPEKEINDSTADYYPERIGGGGEWTPVAAGSLINA